MKVKGVSPANLAEDIMYRSICNVMTGAVIADSRGIFSWGWNHDVGGTGKHAEVHAIERANPARLPSSTIYVCGERKSSGNYVSAIPCEDCYRRIIDSGIASVYYRHKNGRWMRALSS